MAAQAYRQAWNTLLEQREGRRKSFGGGGTRPATKGNNRVVVGEGSNGGGGKGEEDKGGTEIAGHDDNDDEIDMILLQAKIELRSCGSRGTSASEGWSRGSTPQQLQQQLQQLQREEVISGLQGQGARYVSFRNTREAVWSVGCTRSGWPLLHRCRQLL